MEGCGCFCMENQMDFVWQHMESLCMREKAHAQVLSVDERMATIY